MPSLSYSVIDAFTREPFQGNPAAVVEGGDELSDDQIQFIAREFNLSETVFLLRPTGAGLKPAVRLRWFTPAYEVSFCGHATLAAVHLVRSFSEEPWDEIGVECAAGSLVVRVDSPADGDFCYWLSMPPPGLRPADVSSDLLLNALRIPKEARTRELIWQTRDNDVIVFLSRGESVRTLAPDMAVLDRVSRDHHIRGVLVSSTDSGEPEIACTSRFFAPAAGIPEDPATGSVHGPLATLLIRNGAVAPSAPGQWSFCCRQLPANGRVGTVYIRAESLNEDLAVEVGGSCTTVMVGQLWF